MKTPNKISIKENQSPNEEEFVDDSELDIEDNFYKPDEEDILPSEDEPKSVPSAKVNIKQTEYELADLNKKLNNLVTSYKNLKPSKGSEEEKKYISDYKNLIGKIKILQNQIEDDLFSSIEEERKLKEIFSKRAGLS